eukprot:6173652-Pleurochrysis_carterae.AAC.19
MAHQPDRISPRANTSWPLHTHDGVRVREPDLTASSIKRATSRADTRGLPKEREARGARARRGVRERGNGVKNQTGTAKEHRKAEPFAELRSGEGLSVRTSRTERFDRERAKARGRNRRRVASLNKQLLEVNVNTQDRDVSEARLLARNTLQQTRRRRKTIGKTK